MTVGKRRLACAARSVGPAVALLLALLLTACSPPVQGSPEPRAGVGTPSSAATPRSGGCTVTANGTGSINVSGGGGSVVIRNQVTSLSCGAGFVELTRITDGAVTLAADGTPVEVAVGASGAVGRYQVSVLAIDGGTARFWMVAT